METQTQSTSTESQSVEVQNSPADGAWIHKLTPPPGTAFFKKYNVVIDKVVKNITFSITIKVYVYASGANPTEPDFETKGGVFYVIALPQGSVYGRPLKKFQLLFAPLWVTPSPKYYLDFVAGLPAAYSAKEGDVYKYRIDFSQDLRLFSDDQSTMFDHTVIYKDDTNRTTKCTQVCDPDDAAEFSITPDSAGHLLDKIDCFGLCVHKTSLVGSFSYIFKAYAFTNDMHYEDAMIEFPIDLRFI